MGDINTVISVDVTGAGELSALAESAEAAAAALDRLEETAGKGINVGAAAGAGADKLAASYEAAFAKIEAGFGKLQAQLDGLGKAGAGDAGAASLGKLDDSLKGVQEQADAMAASVGKADDTLKGLGETSDASAAGLGKLSDAQKSVTETAAGMRDTSAGVSDGLKVQADQTAALTALQADMADSQKALTALSAEHAAVMTDSNAKIAAGQRLNTAAARDASDDAVAAQKAQSAAATQAAADTEASAGKYHMLMLGGAAALAVGVDMAAKLQTSVTRLYTTAGESAKNLPMMSAGILALSGQTNTSQAQLGQGAYMAESAGFHGQAALNVLKASAEGAQAEGAPLSDTTNALTSLLNAYGMKGAGAPMSAMDQIIAMVSRGKMTMASAVSALPSVLPAASAAKLPFADIGGALATMTSTGISPDRAAQNLSHVITSIMNPSNVQTKEMQQLGINPVQVENQLGKQGLTGTLGELSSTVMKNMGPAGDVLFKTFNQSQSAAQDANKMISAMPASIRSTAQAYADGTVSAAQWNQEMFKGSESAQQKNMLQQFATVENTAKGFNDLLKSGSPDVQTYAAAMDKLLGGQTGLNVAMELTGQHMPVMKANTDAIAAAAKNAGDNVTGWSKVQGTLNFQIGSATKSLEAVATEAGQVALPALTDTLKVASGVGSFLASHPTLSKDLTVGGGALAAMAIIPKLASVGTTAAASVGKVAETLNIPGLSKLSGLGQGAGAAGLDSAASGLSGAAGSLEGAAGSLEGAAGKLAGGGSIPGVAGGGSRGAAEGEAAAVDAEVATADKGILSTIGGTLAKGIGPALLAGIITEMGIKPIAEAHKIPGSGNTWWQGPKDLQTWGGVGHVINQGISQVSQTFTDPFDAIFGTGKPKPPPPPPGKDWTSVTGGSAAYPGAPGGGTPASRFATPPPAQTYPAAPGYGRFGPLGGMPSSMPAPQAPPPQPMDLLGGAGHPGTVTIKPKIEPPDMSTFTSALSQAMGVKPIKLPPPDVSSLKSAESAVSGFEAAMAQAMGHPVKVPSPDLSALKAAAGQASAAGGAVSSGFAAGIMAGEGAAVAAASAVAAAAAAAMHVSLKSASPSKVTEKIGQDFDAGFTQGIAGNSDSVKAASAQIGSDSVSSLLQGLAGGQSNVQNAIQAVMGAAANPDAVTSIQQTIQTLLGDVPAKDTGLVKYLTQQQSKLSSLANQQGAIMSQISNAQQLATSAVSGASITSAYGYTPALAASGGPLASQSIITGMQQQLSDTKSFASTLGQLQKSGLNATTESQLAQAGTVTGLPLALGLQQGGKAAISQMNSIESQIVKAGQKIGSVGGTAMYNAGQAITQGLDQPLKNELKSIDADMSKIANSIIATVEKKLGTKATSTSSGSSTAAATASSSSAGSTASAAATGLSKTSSAAGGAASGLAAVGSAAGGAASGLGAVASAAAGAAAALGKIAGGGGGGSGGGSGSGASGGGGSAAGGGGGSSSAGGGGGGSNSGEPVRYGPGAQLDRQAPQVQVTHVHNWNIQGNVMAEADFQTNVQNAMLQLGSRNWTTGVIFPGRHN